MFGINFFQRKIKPLDVIKELRKVPTDQWAEIYCVFNTWGFPKQLDHIKPEWWDDTISGKVGEKKSAMIGPILKLINETIGKQATSRYWNTVHRTDPGKMTVEQHDRWWFNERLKGESIK